MLQRRREKGAESWRPPARFVFEFGLWDLFSRMCRWRLPARWYVALLIPPILVLTVLFLLETFVSPVYAPNRFLVGIFFGVPAGFLEEIGWMGYAFPKMRSQQ